MASPLVGVAVINSLLFAVYGSALRIFSKDAKDPTVGDIFIAGSISGFVNGFFSTPIELVKIRLQNQTNSPRHYGGEMYKGPTDCVRQILKQNGLKGLFKGLPTTLLRETPSYGGIYSPKVKRTLHHTRSSVGCFQTQTRINHHLVFSSQAASQELLDGSLHTQ